MTTDIKNVMPEFKAIVNWSGGLCSFWAAKRVIDKHGPTATTLLFADTLIEAPDLYQFNQQASALLGVGITRVSKEMTPWELFRKQGMIANNRFPICSIYLKRAVLDEWIEANCCPASSVIYLGFDWTECHRLEHIRTARPDWRFEAPMTEAPIWDKCKMQSEAEKLGLVIPQLYRLGFPHNNCGGRCVRAGISHWVKLYKELPERFLEWEMEELNTIKDLTARGISSRWFSFLRDRRGGTVKTLTLQSLRLRIEAGEKFRGDDWGGCGCGGVVEATNGELVGSIKT